MDGKKPVSLAWLRSTLGEGVWADNPAIEGLPQAWLTFCGDVQGKIADVQVIEDAGHFVCYSVWLAGEDEARDITTDSHGYKAWLDETPAPAPTPSLADEMSETARVIRESLDETPAPALRPPTYEEEVLGIRVDFDEDEDDYLDEEIFDEDEDDYLPDDETGPKSVTVSLPSDDIEMSFEGDTLVLTLPAVDGFSWRDLFGACVGQRVELRLSAFVGNFPTIEEGA